MSDMQKEIGRLADLFEYGHLKVSTDPGGFLREVREEILRLRSGVDNAHLEALEGSNPFVTPGEDLGNLLERVDTAHSRLTDHIRHYHEPPSVAPDNPPTPPKEANPAEGSAQCPHCKRVFETIWRDARKGRFYCALCGEWFWVDATGQSQPTSPKEPDEIREGYRQGYEAGAEAVRLEKLLSKEPEGGKEGAPRYLQNAIETIRARRAKEGGTP